MIMVVVGYLMYCVITLWVCAGAFIMSSFAGGVHGRWGVENWVLNGVALLMLYGVYHWWPFNPLTLAI